jgi:hypothetical protein
LKALGIRFPDPKKNKRPYDLIPDLPPGNASEKQAAFDSRLAQLNTEIKDLKSKCTQLTEQLTTATGGIGFYGFETQPVGQRPDESFGRFGLVTVDAAAQSPYQNAFPAGTRGLSAPSDSSNNAFIRPVEPSHTAQTTPRLYYNIDFRSEPTEMETGGAYRFYLGQGPGNSAAVEMGASATTFYVKNGSQLEPLCDLHPGTWYNLQFELDLQSRVFSGTIGTPGNVVSFADKSVSDGWNGTIDQTFVDKYGPGSGILPAWQVDNLAVRTTPFLAVGELLESSEKPGGLTAAEVVEATNLMGELSNSIADLKQQRDTLKVAGPYEMIYGAVEGAAAKDASVQLRGNKLNQGDVVPRRNLEILGNDPLDDDTVSGRIDLPDWLTRPSNPLTARVIVNRIWQHHFGRGIVTTENDFGARGDRPTHPELLDWLASRFVESGWSMKAMHRLIMSSHAYQQSSEHDSMAAEDDPQASLLWRFNRRRLSAEEIRDAMLFVSGSLDSSVGEQHPFPAVETWAFTQHSPYYGVYPSKRRSVYLMQQRLKRHPFLSLFDGADPNASTARRGFTTVPTQALYLMNSEFVHECASSLAARVLEMNGETSDHIAAAYEISLGRHPDDDERSEASAFLVEYTTSLGDAESHRDRLVLNALVRMLLTRNEFLYVD